MNITVKLRRQTSRTSEPTYQTFQIEADPTRTTVLDALIKIQSEQDGSIGFRRNCRNAICGSCSMRINGRSGLACQKHISEVMGEFDTELVIEPMQNLPVIKDLIVDMTKFWDNLAKVDPYVSTASRQISKTEYLQTPAQRSKLQAAANCILCGSCYSECNAAAVSDRFVGPHALAKAYRVMADNRDDQTEERVSKYNESGFVWDCTRCYNCNEVCPVEVQPLDRISQIKHEILANQDLPESTAQRHRHTMVELVKEDGWIDESKFGVKVVGDNFRDLKGLLSIFPLGVRMILSGKMPYPWQFQKSEGAVEAKALIEAIASVKNQKMPADS
jgi:succinate dehydrogenase / fumarate reductase, iron-sulfur subunit